jgi:outer membrane protein TolC
MVMHTNGYQDDKPSRRTLLLLTQAYNRGEISFDEWLEQTRAWAEAVIAQAQALAPAPAKRAKPD